MKQKWIIAIGMFIVVLLAVVLYPSLGRKAITDYTYDYLHQDGYTPSQIALVDVRHSYISGLLGYGQWHTSLFFTDEPEIEYHCILSNRLFPKVLAITAGGFSTNLPQNYEPMHYSE